MPEELETFSFSGDGRLIAATSYGDDVVLWDVSIGGAVGQLNPRSGAVEDLQESENVAAMAFSPDSTMLFTATSYGTMRLWDITSGRLDRELTGPADAIRFAVFSPDCDVLASIHSGDLRLWDVTSGQLIQQVGIRRVKALAFRRLRSILQQVAVATPGP